MLYMENLGNDTWLRAFTAYARKHNCLPDFVNMHYYADIIPPNHSQNYYIGQAATSTFPKRTDDFSLWIGSLRKVLASLNMDTLPIYLTEWNLTFSHRNLVNDTCFKSCYIMKTC